MEILKTERPDHLGIVMGTIKELGIVKFIDNKINNSSSNYKISIGQAVAAMVVNGLGFF